MRTGHRGRTAAEIAVVGFVMRKLFSGVLGTGQRTRRDQLANLAPPPGSVVLLGDSITEFGEWEELLPERRIVNRGIGGETASQVRDRVETAINKPAVIALLIGTNDLMQGIPPARIADTVAGILDDFQRLAPSTPVILQSVMPRSRSFAPEVRDVNRRYQALAASRSTVTYLDLWPALADGDAIRTDFTFDHLHLNGAGYRAWVALLAPALDHALSDQTQTGSASGHPVPPTRPA